MNSVWLRNKILYFFGILKFVYFQAGARGFQDLPPEIVGKIMSYLETTDKKKMRCVSKW